MEITHCFTLLFIVFFNGSTALQYNRTILGYIVHGLVLKRHLSRYPNLFHSSAHEWYNSKSIESPSLTLMKKQAGTIIIFSSSQCCNSSCIKTIHKRHFTPFLTIFIHTPIPLVTWRRMALIDATLKRFEMRES